MKKQIADKWITALRSGYFKQCSGRLSNGIEYCCLGVLCELAALENICTVGKDSDFNTNKKYDDQVAILPESVKKWSGIKSDNGALDTKHYSLFNHNKTQVTSYHDALAKLNDGVTECDPFTLKEEERFSLTFNEIADIIQVTYKEL